MLLIEAVGALKTEKERKDGKPSRQYYVLEAVDANNPMLGTQRNIFSDQFGKFKGGSPEVMKLFIGKNIEGSIQKIAVKPYEITDRISGEKRQVSSYTAIVFGHETAAQVAKAAGHELAEEVTTLSNANELAA